MIARTTRLGALALAAALALTGCASGSAADADTAPALAEADTVTVSDAWVKAADEGMTGAFAALTNDGAADVTVVAASTDAAAMVELHETAMGDDGEMAMSEVDGGFLIAAGGTRALEPGADHIMLMSLTGPLVAGDEVTVTLTFADESTLEFTAPVKDYTGANENYVGGDDTEMDE
ncbi:copper chaperone PCu(A)C [Microbacter sp. GSS18]|nr:copper chaperone PCu(A)C [Microbacter sp. GSS18]